MARPLRIEYPGAFYHITQRGNERRDIFLSGHDRAKFYEYIALMHTRYKINIHTYCLMKNHYHLVLETENANLSRAMHFLNTGYTVYFNHSKKRTGHLFQGRYKTVLVEADEYLERLSAYIHLNPVRAGLVVDPSAYPHSSCRYFFRDAMMPDWLRTDFILSTFDKNIKKARTAYRKFVFDAIADGPDIIRENTKYGFLLGTQKFIDDIKSKFIEGKSDPEIPVLKAAQRQLDPDVIKKAVAKKNGDNKLSRKTAIYLIRKHTALSLNEIASLFNGISDAGVSALCQRVDAARKRDKSLDGVICDIEKMLKVET